MEDLGGKVEVRHFCGCVVDVDGYVWGVWGGDVVLRWRCVDDFEGFREGIFCPIRERGRFWRGG